MRLFGIDIPLGTTPEAKLAKLWSKSAIEDPTRIDRQLATLGENRANLAMNCINLAKGEPVLPDLRKFASILMREGVSPRHLRGEALLAASVGPRLAKAMLGRESVRERWNAVIQLADGGPVTSQITRGEALRLSRELVSPQAVALRNAVAAAKTGYRELIAKLAPDLSLRAVELCLKAALRPNDAATALHSLHVEQALGAMFRAAGETTIRPLAVKELLADDTLLLDAFELFIEANDRALGTLAAMTDAMNAALQSGAAIAAHTEGRSLGDMIEALSSDVGHMLEWHAALYGTEDTNTLQSTADRLLGCLPVIADTVNAALATHPRLNSGTTDLDSAPAYVKDPCSRLLEVCSKSKPEVEIATIATVEELIRVLHREAAAGFGDAVQRISKGAGRGRSTETVHANAGAWSTAALSVRSAYSRADFDRTPMGAVGNLFRRYIDRSSNGELRIKSAVLTDQSFSFDVSLGYHTGRLSVIYDPTQQTYALEWGMQEPGFGKRKAFCSQYFPLAGFTHSGFGWKHTATRTVTRDEMPEALAFLLFSLENMKDVDVRAPRYNPVQLKNVFDGWYATFSGSAADVTDLASSAIEARIATLVEANPHLFRMAATTPSYATSDLIDAARAFVISYADVLFASTPDRDALTGAIAHAARVGDVQLKMLGLKGSRIDETMVGALASDAAWAVDLDANGKISTSSFKGTGGISGPVYQYAGYAGQESP